MIDANVLIGWMDGVCACMMVRRYCSDTRSMTIHNTLIFSPHSQCWTKPYMTETSIVSDSIVRTLCDYTTIILVCCILYHLLRVLLGS
jgi:hypothetical protein